MISERQFIRFFPEFWQRAFPYLEQHMSRLSREKIPSTLMSRFDEPLKTGCDPQWNDIIAEISFTCFSRIHQKEHSGWFNENQKDHLITEDDVQSAIVKMAHIRGSPLLRHEVSKEIIRDSATLALRLIKYFKEYSEIKVHPKLRGFAYLSTLHPDVMAPKIIFEVKSTIGVFKKEDLKQLITYYLLSQLNEHKVDTLALLNPRRGVCYSISVEMLLAVLGAPDQIELIEQFKRTLLD
jgi:hypothetical protein